MAPRLIPEYYFALLLSQQGLLSACCIFAQLSHPAPPHGFASPLLAQFAQPATLSHFAHLHPAALSHFAQLHPAAALSHFAHSQPAPALSHFAHLQPAAALSPIAQFAQPAVLAEAVCADLSQQGLAAVGSTAQTPNAQSRVNITGNKMVTSFFFITTSRGFGLTATVLGQIKSNFNILYSTFINSMPASPPLHCRKTKGVAGRFAPPPFTGGSGGEGEAHTGFSPSPM
jgi:hypothetical protein